MRKIAIAACAGLVSLVLAGCATNQRFTERMNSLMGLSEGSLIQQLGSPASVYGLADGSKILTFRRGSTIQMGGGTTYQPVMTQSRGTVSAYGSGGSAYGNYSGTTTSYQAVQQPTYDINLHCEANITVDAGGTARSWSASGNHCVAK